MPKPEFYSDVPHAPRKKLAVGKLTEQTSSLGNEPPAMVPSKPGGTSGLAGPEHAVSHPPKPKMEPPVKVHPFAKAAHGYGHPAAARVGHLRLSGHSGAHLLGKKS
jgi:hypothetical protein